MAFVETRLLDCVTYGTAGGPSWLTRKVGLRNGYIRRNPQRSRPLYRFRVIYRNLLDQDHEAVLDAFNACMGGAFGFRIKDWSDYVATDELLGLGTGAPQTVQLVKLYTFGSRTVSRPIRKPVSPSVIVTADGIPIAATIDYTTGEATYTAGSGDIVRWSGEFDVPVCFMDDELQFSIDNKHPTDGFFLTADVGLEEDLSA